MRGVCVFVTKVDLSSTQGALCTVSEFFILHVTYLGGCVCTQRTPCLWAWLVTTVWSMDCGVCVCVLQLSYRH